ERLRVAGRTPYLYYPRSFPIDAGNLAQAAIGRWPFPARAADNARKTLPVKGLIPLKFDDRAERHGASPPPPWPSAPSLRAAPPPGAAAAPGGGTAPPRAPAGSPTDVPALVAPPRPPPQSGGSSRQLSPNSCHR